MVPLAVTTSGKPDEALVKRAREAARAWKLPFIPRRKKEPIGPLLESAADAFLVFEREGVSLWDREGSFSFNPGMAHLRRLRILSGQVGGDDALVRVAELRAGDHLLDCTLGLGQDALVAALVVGPRGRVVGLEKSLALHAVVSEGLAAYDYGPQSCRVEAVHADSHTYLRSLPSGSFDVVLFDPMFEKPKKSQPAFEMLRRFAEHAPLLPETLEEARRVARRWVVVKGSKYSDDLKKLGLEAEPGSRYTSMIWGRIAAASSG
ncbi:putative SAM-dependent methyltransferase [Archangium gephyra]|uniref:Protein-L-isoD(D-D) O-methyltransferase n=1 Tax=Archangium gephyra TaxID=48 RepID=A0AAC8QA22_9BACT|nr:class I SAM-dependent methyltransferase [Archangium gephyra]AKJ03649.1 Protein-L-isoD(D-D) O-methyltransferase [Archangium gephyra]REG22570.1 putative SAM-dependent methyltransferase [Archangium gephyra]